MERKVSRREFLRWGSLTAAGVLAACAPKSAPAREPTSVPSAATVQATDVPPMLSPTQQPVTLTIWEWFDDRKPYYHAMTKEWAERYNPNVSWDVVFTPGEEYWTKLRAAVPSGVGPDVFRAHMGYITELIENKFVEPLDELRFPSDMLKKEFQGFAEGQLTYADGRNYFLSDGAIGPVMVASKEMWDEAGLTEEDIPETWDELIEVAKVLTKNDQRGEITQFGFSAIGHYWEMLRGLQYQQGSWLFSEDAKKVRFDNDAARRSLQLFDDFITQHKVDSRSGLNFLEGFGTGKIAMTWTWTWMQGYMRTTYPDVAYFTFPVVGLSPNDNPAYGVKVWELSIVANPQAPAERKQLAQDFVAWYFLSDEHEYLLDAAEAVAGIPQKIKLQGHPRVTGSEMTQALAKRSDRLVFIGDEVDSLIQLLKRNIDQSFVQGGEKLDSTIAAIQSEGDRIMGERDYWIVERRYKHAGDFGP